MALPVPLVAAPEVSLSATTPKTPTEDERWSAWKAKGAAHDLAVRRKVMVAAPVLIVVAVILYALLGR